MYAKWRRAPGDERESQGLREKKYHLLEKEESERESTEKKRMQQNGTVDRKGARDMAGRRSRKIRRKGTES